MRFIELTEVRVDAHINELYELGTILINLENITHMKECLVDGKTFTILNFSSNPNADTALYVKESPKEILTIKRQVG